MANLFEKTTGLFKPSSLGIGGGGGGGQMSASDTFAALTRQQWNDYLSNFVPIENTMIQYATDPLTVQNAVAEARSDVAGSFAAQEGINARRLSGLGLTLNADEQKASNREMGLQKSLADVTAANITTERVTDRQRALLGAPAPNLRTS